MHVQKISVRGVNNRSQFIVLLNPKLSQDGITVWEPASYISNTVPANGEMSENWKPNVVANKLSLQYAWAGEGLVLDVAGIANGEPVVISTELPVNPRLYLDRGYVSDDEIQPLTVELPIGGKSGGIPWVLVFSALTVGYVLFKRRK